MKKASRHGFTVAELLIVVAIIAVLVGTAIPIFRKKVEKSREAYDIYTMRQAASAAVDLYYMNLTDSASAGKAGLSWNGSPGHPTANAYGAYDPGTGKFYETRDALISAIKKPYGKGTKTKGGADYYMGSDTTSAYMANEDYNNAVVMVSIYPNAVPPHAVVYWKYAAGTNKGKYVGNGSNNHPNHYIYIPFN